MRDKRTRSWRGFAASAAAFCLAYAFELAQLVPRPASSHPGGAAVGATSATVARSSALSPRRGPRRNSHSHSAGVCARSMMLAITASRSSASIRSLSYDVEGRRVRINQQFARTLAEKRERRLMVGAELELVSTPALRARSAPAAPPPAAACSCSRCSLMSVCVPTMRISQPSALPLDDTRPTLLVPAPLAVARADTVSMLVDIRLAARVAQIGLMVGAELVGVDQAVPVGLRAASSEASVAQLLQAFIDIAQVVVWMLHLPDEGAGATQCAAVVFDVAGACRALSRRIRPAAVPAASRSGSSRSPARRWTGTAARAPRGAARRDMAAAGPRSGGRRPCAWGGTSER